MAKEIISATIESKTVKEVREISKKEKRSFSQMIDLLLQIAIPVFVDKKK